MSTYPVWVCHDCGSKYQTRPARVIATTWHDDTCDVCGEQKPVTEPRDFGYPVFPMKSKGKR